MRFVLVAFVACGLALPPLPVAAKSAPGAASKMSAKSQPGKQKRVRASGKKDLGGIHPLVGSGDY